MWSCFSKATATIQPADIPDPVPVEKDDSGVFPILKLPEELAIQLVGHMTPFDILAFSLCNEITKSLAKKSRCLPKFKNDCKPFKFCVGAVYQRMIMEFEEFPKVYFQLLRNRELIEKYYPQVKLKDVVMSGWDSREYERKLFANSRTNFEGIPATFKTLHITSDNSVAELHKFFSHLCDVFNPRDRIMSIDLDCQLMESLLYHYREKGEVWQHLIIQASENTSETYIRSVFDRVRVSKGLFLRCKVDSNFYYDLGRFKMEESLEIHFSCWVELEQIFNIKCEKVSLFLSSLVTEDFKVLIDKWRAGWTPQWKEILIELKRMTKALEDCIEGQYVFITDAKDRSLVDKSSSIQLYKFEAKFRIEETSFYVNGYHIVREDGAIATVYITKGNVAVFIIHPRKSKKDFVFDFNRRLFLPRKVWS